MSDESVFSTAEWGIETARSTPPSVATDTRKTLDQMVANAAQKENVILDTAILNSATLNTAAESYQGAQEALGKTKEVVTDAKAAIGDKAIEAAKATRQFVGSHPWVSIGTGAAIGFLTGMLARRR